MSYTGQCACGAVTLEISGPAIAVRQCWCRQCQQIAAGGPTQNAIFMANDVTIIGELAAHSYVAASGNRVSQNFCPKCGSHMTATNSARMQMCAVRLGAIDVPHDLKPQGIIWTADAPPWAILDPALEQISSQPTPPPTAPPITPPAAPSLGR